MKIGITTFGADGGKSGIGQYLINLLREFSSSFHEDTFEVIAHESECEVFAQPTDNFRLCRVSDRLRDPLLNIAWHQLVLPDLCWRRGYDVLFLPAGNRRLPIVAPCPTVGTVHDFSSLHVEQKYDHARMGYIKHVLPRLVRRLTKVITVSESAKQDIVEYARVCADRVIVTPLAADKSKFVPVGAPQSARRVQTELGLEGPYILYVSRIEHPGKNHVRLIQAFDKLKAASAIPHQLVLAGAARERAAEVFRAARASPFSDAIRFTEFVPVDVLPALYRGADVFVFPSLYEGFGLPLLEAMGCGTAVACSNVSSLPEVAGDAAILFDPCDTDAMSLAMRSLITDPALKNDHVQRGFRRSAGFEWSVTASRTLDVLHCAANP